MVYPLGDACFVIDGHHRVAIAPAAMEQIEVEVSEVKARGRSLGRR